MSKTWASQNTTLLSFSSLSSRSRYAFPKSFTSFALTKGAIFADRSDSNRPEGILEKVQICSGQFNIGHKSTSRVVVEQKYTTMALYFVQERRINNTLGGLWLGHNYLCSTVNVHYNEERYAALTQITKLLFELMKTEFTSFMFAVCFSRYSIESTVEVKNTTHRESCTITFYKRGIKLVCTA